MKSLYLVSLIELRAMLLELEDDYSEYGNNLYDEVSNEIDRRVNRKAV